MTDAEFLERFEAADISAESWGHDDHLRMAFLYLRDFDWDVALDRMRTGIQRLNSANGVPNTIESGYHETMTIAWAALVRAAMSNGDGSGHALDFVRDHPHLRDKTLLRAHYSRERILTAEAKARWVEPDLEALPNPHGERQ